MNRSIFSFNESLDDNVMKPVAEGYRFVTPDPVEIMISNFYSNLDDVKVIFNDLLQLKFRNAGADSTRFLINTILGMGGLVDFGTDYGFPKRHEDFGQTLGHWGVSTGPYIVLPIIGGSNMRDAPAMLVDVAANPATYMGFVTIGIAPAMGAVAAVDTRAGLLDTEEIVDEAALDKYEFLRDAYLQRRRSLVHDGNPPRTMDDELAGPDGTDQDSASLVVHDGNPPRTMDDELAGPDGTDQDLVSSTEKKRSITIEYIDPEDSENQGASTD
jgi:phospholipid-binding lipoprotein MlaA